MAMDLSREQEEAIQNAVRIEMLNSQAERQGSWAVGLSALGLILLPFILPLVSILLGFEVNTKVRQIRELGGDLTKRSSKAARDAFLAGIIVFTINLVALLILLNYVAKR